MLDKLRSWIIPLVYLTDNWISLIGVVLVTTCAVFWIFLLPLMLSGGPGNPYIGILTYMLLPGAFFLSLLFIPLGIIRKRRAQGLSTSEIVRAPLTLDFRRAEIRHLAGFIIAATI